MLTVLLAYVLACSAWLLWHYLDPALAPKGDQRGYIWFAVVFREHGFLSPALGTVRTYAYPAFLYLITYLPGVVIDQAYSFFRTIALWSGALQVAIYGAVVVWLSRLVRSPVLARAVLLGLLFNPFALLYVTAPMTDGPSLIASVLLVVILLKASEAPRPFAWLVGGAALAALAVMIRPANVALLAAWTLAALYASGRRLAVTYVLAAVAITAALWAPQVAYNAIHYGVASALPLCPGGAIQTGLGILNVKYSSLSVGSEAHSLWYPNPFFSGTIPKGFFMWYLSHPGAGIATLATKAVNLFDVDQLAIYLTHPRAWYSPAASFVSFAALALAADRATTYAAIAVRTRTLDPAALFVILAWGLTLATGLLVMVETRFGLQLIAINGVLAADWFLRARWRAARWPLGLAVLCGVAGALVSYKIAALATLDRPYPQGFEQILTQLPPHRCDS
jgi:hypothetical protein